MSGLSDARARALVEGGPDALVVVDRRGVVCGANPAAERLFGGDDIVGSDHRTLLSDGSADRFAHAFEELAADPTPRQVGSDLDVFGRRADGSSFPVEVNFGLVPHSDSTEIVASVRDVSLRHSSESGLRDALSLLAATLESTADGILVVSSEGKINGANSRFVQMWGIPDELMASEDDERVMGFVLDQLVDAQAFVAKVMELYSHPDEESNDVLEFTDGRVFERYSRPQRVGQEIVGRVWSFRDVTPRVRAQREAEEARTAALEASRAKSDFLSTMSHEIRTPMNGVIGLTGLLLNTELDEVQRRYAAGVRGAGEALLGIIDDILDFSKLEAGKVDLEHVEFSPRQLVEEVGVLLADAAGSQGLAFIVQCDPSVPAAVTGDPGRLRQALINLTGNAIKFTPAGQVLVTVFSEDCGARAVGEPVALRFEVRDTGVGIAPDTIARLFQPFSQADASTTRLFGGTGLGLAISSRLVRAMGGDLGVESEPGRGSTFGFTLCLPVARDLPAPSSDLTALEPLRALVVDDSGTSRETQVGQPNGGGVRTGDRVEAPQDGLGLVLVAEDNPVNQMVALGFLEALGYQGELVTDGAQALAALETGRFDLVLMDCHMPGMDGFEATRRLRAAEADGRRTPVIALTAGVLDEDRERCLAAGMDDFVPKPIDVVQLRRTLGRWLPADEEPSGTVSPLDQARVGALRAAGKPDGWGILPDVIRLFLSEADEQRVAMTAAMKSGDSEELARVVHSLKGAAANVGASDVAEACAEVEQAIRSTGAVPAQRLVQGLFDALDAACAALERLLSTAP